MCTSSQLQPWDLSSNLIKGLFWYFKILSSSIAPNSMESCCWWSNCYWHWMTNIKFTPFNHHPHLLPSNPLPSSILLNELSLLYNNHNKWNKWIKQNRGGTGIFSVGGTLVIHSSTERDLNLIPLAHPTSFSLPTTTYAQRRAYIYNCSVSLYDALSSWAQPSIWRPI